MLINCIIKGKHVDGVDEDGNKHYGFCSDDCPKHVDLPGKRPSIFLEFNKIQLT